MSEQELEALRTELEKVKAELKKEQENNNLDEIRAKYEKVIEDKNKEINELSKTNQAIQERMDNTVSNLNDEVKLKLEQSEQLIELNKLETLLFINSVADAISVFCHYTLLFTDCQYLPLQHKKKLP